MCCFYILFICCFVVYSSNYYIYNIHSNNLNTKKGMPLKLFYILTSEPNGRKFAKGGNLFAKVCYLNKRTLEITLKCVFFHLLIPWASFWENQYSGFPTRSDTNWVVQPLKMASGLKFRILEIEGLYYRCRENKDADQLRSYHEADLHLCFRICKSPVFSERGSYVVSLVSDSTEHYWYTLSSSDNSIVSIFTPNLKVTANLKSDRLLLLDSVHILIKHPQKLGWSKMIYAISEHYAVCYNRFNYILFH